MGVNHHQRILFELFYDRVYKTAYYIVKDVYLAQDITQETFIKAFRHIENCPDGEKAGAWLSTIATRTAIDYIRLQKRRNDFPTDNIFIENVSFHDETAMSVETEVEISVMLENVLKQMHALDPELQEVIVLKYMCELKDTEIAEVMKMKVGTVKSRIYRAKNKLRSIIEEKNVSDGERL